MLLNKFYLGLKILFGNCWTFLLFNLLIIARTVSARVNLNAGTELFLFSFLSNLKVILGVKAGPEKRFVFSGIPGEPELLETPETSMEPSLNPRDSLSSSPFSHVIKFFLPLDFNSHMILTLNQSRQEPSHHRLGKGGGTNPPPTSKYFNKKRVPSGIRLHVLPHGSPRRYPLRHKSLHEATHGISLILS